MMPKVTVKFRGAKSAGEFAANFAILDDKAKVTTSGTSATVTSSNPKTVALVKQMARDIVEDRRFGGMVDAMLGTIRTCLSEDRAVQMSLLDGSVQTMSPAHAQAFARAHDRLNEENQGAFLILASESKDAYARCLGFARKNEETY
jgi:hypothetical protein